MHRHMHKSQGTVYAYPDELDAWRTRGEAQVDFPDKVQSSPSHDRSIAVLPFRYVGPDSANVYIADGCTEEVINGLTKIRALRVISRTSSMVLKDTQKDARTLAKTLRVRFLLEGTVRQHTSQLRVSARLIDPTTDEGVWAEQYDGPVETVFSIQERIARDVAAALHLRLTVDDERRLAHRGVEDVLAWRYALQARQESLRWRPDAIQQAIALLDLAIKQAGEQPALLTALGRTWLQFREAGIDTSSLPIEKARTCAERIREQIADAVEWRQLEGWIQYATGNIRAAVAQLNRVLRETPNDPDTLGLLANCYLISGRVVLARPVIERLLAIDPLTPLTRCLPGWADALEGDFATAVKAYQDMYDADPGNPLGRLFLLWILASSGNIDRALELASNFPESPDNHLPQQVARIFHAGLSGAPLPDGQVLLDNASAIAASSDMYPRLISQAYALAGDAELSAHWMSLALERGFINYPYLAQHDPLLVRVRQTESFQALLSRVRTRWQNFDDVE